MSRRAAIAFGLVTPTYVPPTFAPELPAAAASGYDLAWPSARKETLPSGQGARRVALFTRNWPVSVERSLYPAVFPEASIRGATCVAPGSLVAMPLPTRLRTAGSRDIMPFGHSLDTDPAAVSCASRLEEYLE